MTTVLFATLDAGGNLPPALDIAREIVRRGGSAHFLGHEPQRAAIEGAGFSFEPYPTGRSVVAAAPGGLLAVALRQARVFADAAIGRDIVATATRLSPDVVVIDCLLAGGMIAALDAGLPAVSLMHTVWSFWHRMQAGPIGTLVRVLGADIGAAFDRPRVALVTTRLDFEEDANPAPNARHTGFILGSPAVEATSAARPRVLVSLSTTNLPGQERSLQRILDAIGGLELDAIVTTGPAIDPARLRAPANAEVVRFADHLAILPGVSLVICHGGHSTTARALAHGIPVLVLPQNAMIDQPAIGRAVQRLGVGRTLRRTAPVAELRAAITGLLAGPQRDAARQLGADIRAHDGAGTAAGILERMAVEA